MNTHFSHLFNEQNQKIIQQEVEKVSEEARTSMEKVIQKNTEDVSDLNRTIQRLRGDLAF